jgi:hypothetical protein
VCAARVACLLFFSFFSYWVERGVGSATAKTFFWGGYFKLVEK